MLANLGGWHFLLILAVILLLFGAAKLPGLAKSFGQSVRILRTETAAGRDDEGQGSATERALSVASAGSAAPPIPKTSDDHPNDPR